jgi:hypothetical protein
VVPLATSAASWSAVMLLAVSAVRRSALPAPVAGVLLGGAVVVGDSLLRGVGEQAKERAERAREAAEAAASADAASDGDLQT